MKAIQYQEKINQTWLLGEWQYLPDSRLLKKGNIEQRLSQQLNQVLLLLIKRAPQVVTRQQFLDVIWSNKFVNEDALSRSIAELRKLLGDSASEARYIKTIPKKGYQLVQLIEPVKTRNNRRFKTVLMTLMAVLLLMSAYWLNRKDPTVNLLQEAVANASRVTALPGMEKQSILSHDGQSLIYVKDTPLNSQIIIESVADAKKKELNYQDIDCHHRCWCLS